VAVSFIGGGNRSTGENHQPLEYADVILDNNITYLVDKIVKLQMEAARIVTGGTRLVSLNNICLETGWEVG
jgi:hypothetical protein